VSSTSSCSELSSETLRNYYAQLAVLETRMPSLQSTLTFSWTDSLQGGNQKFVARSDVLYERASILFNIAALASLRGVSADRSSFEACKATQGHFLEAAGVLAHLRDSLAPRCVRECGGRSFSNLSTLSLNHLPSAISL
jgi:hypothetical protein